MPRIGSSNRVGSIGKAGKRTGWIGTAAGTVGSSLVKDQNKSMALYPTTTTTSTSSTTTTTTSTAP